MYMQPRNSLCVRYVTPTFIEVQCLFHFSIDNIFSERMGHLRGQ